MTLAAGYKFEHPKAQGVSPILLLSDSRYSRGGQPHRDDGKKIYNLAGNIFAVFAGSVLEAQRALAQVKKCLALSSSGSFEDLGFILKSSFDSKIATWDDQAPHCLLGAISRRGDSKLFYAQPDGRSYKVSELSQDVKESFAVIGYSDLESKLQEKIYAPKPKGLYHPEHFMCLPDEVFPAGYDRKIRAIQEAREISGHISMAFVEIVEESKEVGVHLPLQSVLLLPSGPEQNEIYDVASSTQITRKTARASEVSGESDPSYKAIRKLNIRYLT